MSDFKFWLPCKTKDGREVELVSYARGIALGLRFPLVGIIKCDTEYLTWTVEGKYFLDSDSDFDLVNMEEQ